MIEGFKSFYESNILDYFGTLSQTPGKTIALIVDIAIVVFLIVKFFQIVKGTRAWQLLKGIIFLIVITALSSLFGLRILNYILTSFMTYGMLILIVIFQPELRRALEQLGTNKVSKFFGLDKDLATKTTENMYKITIAAMELAKSKTGGLIVIERDIQIKDIMNTGITLDAEISPQLLVNIFTTKTPLHDGAVIISENKIAAAACMLPLASDSNISKSLGTRHRAGIGISKESDSVAIIISEETGRVSVARDGALITDVKEDSLKKILIKYVVTKRFGDENKKSRIAKWKAKFEKKKKA